MLPSNPLAFSQFLHLSPIRPPPQEYYKKQFIVPEGEWDDFMATLNKNLPVTFRITGSGKFAADLRSKLENDFLSQMSAEPLIVRSCHRFSLFCPSFFMFYTL